MRVALLSLVAVLAGCSRSTSVSLVEGFCLNNEADRCYFDTPVMDGF
jgi:hypothetical protein